MERYIDGFVLPIPRDRLDEYRQVVAAVAGIWKEHGALEYVECVGDDMSRTGTRTFAEMLSASEGDVVIFGWVVFESKESRDVVNKKVETDPRMVDLVAPLLESPNPVFDGQRMAYAGFRPLLGVTDGDR